jgi:hypothetical protein
MSNVVVTTAMLQPITDTITSSLPVLLPVGIGLLAIGLGVSLIPRIIYKFF